MFAHRYARQRLSLLLALILGLVSGAVPARAVQPNKTARSRRKQVTTIEANDGQPAKAPADRHSKGSGPITIEVIGNHLVIHADDPQTLALVQDLARTLLEQPKGEGHFEMIHLENANAADAAKILDEAFNGPAPQASPPPQVPALFSRRFRTLANQPPASPPVLPRIRVVADTVSNSLLVRASPLDMLEVRRLVKEAVDAGETESKAVIHTWLVGPLHFANAQELAPVLRDVYREQMNNNPPPSVVAGLPRRVARRLPGVVTVDANGNPRAVTLSIGVDERTNSLVLACPEKIKELVRLLELKSREATRTVRVVTLKGIDPALVQQAIDVIQGRRPSTATANALSSGRPASFNGNSPRGAGGR
jgi:type II secretory pathway component GspD/PulD (secretin)